MLRPGDTIGIAAPASGFPDAPFREGVAWLEAQGFRVVWDPGLFERQAYMAGSPARRIDELHRLFADPSVDAILCARGGYGVMRILDGLDWGLIARHPKVFVGYSDLTPLLAALRDRSDLVCFHGPVMTGLIPRTDEAGRAHLLRCLMDPSVAPPALEGGVTVRSGVVEAEAIGGNLSLLAATIGTPWQVRPRGRILLIEEVGERPYRVDRLLTQLKLAGMFTEVGGVAIGALEGCEEAPGKPWAWDGLFDELLGDLGVPVCWGLPFGHGLANRTIPLGTPLRLDAAAGTLTPLGPSVAPRDRPGFGVV